MIRLDIEVVKKLITKNESQHKRFIKNVQIAERYYENKNDIIRKTAKDSEANPLRNADNRIPRNFHSLLVNQKASYMLTAPPLFDVGNKEANQKIADVLGDSYAKKCKDLCVKAANAGVAWLHYWNDSDNKFQYAVMDSKQIIPFFSKKLEQELIAVLRNYADIDETNGSEIVVWEYWTDTECHVYMQKKDTTVYTGLECYNIHQGIDENAKLTNIYQHNLGEVPFIPFFNNNIRSDDLQNIKPLIDAYDKVFSGFLNDLEDLQEVVFILTNYGGEDLGEFLKNIKKYKTIKVDADSDNAKSDVKTLNIEIPIEARKEFLEITRRAIFEQGQGVDPNPEKFGNTSGEALKFLYSLLELKAGFAETEFRSGFGSLIRAICKYLGVTCGQIMQTWTRTAVTNDREQAEIAKSSYGVISQRSILKYHPWVDNADDEILQIKKEIEEAQRSNDYENAFNYVNNGAGGDAVEE